MYFSCVRLLLQLWILALLIPASMAVSAIKQHPLNTAVYVRQDILGRLVQQVSLKYTFEHTEHTVPL